MKDPEKAFKWIVGILKREKIPYRISGGLAARAYGSKRELADIDIETDKKDILRLASQVAPYIIFGPARYSDEYWDLERMTLKYEGQEIDISSIQASFYNHADKAWEDISGELDEAEVKEIFGVAVPVEPVESLISYKQKLAREVDLEDIRQLSEHPEMI